MKYSEKASKYLEFSGIEKPDRFQRDKKFELRNALASAGLDPQHSNGLTYRALVYDHRKSVEKFLKLIAAKKDTAGLGWELRSFGIRIDRPNELRLILAEIKKNAKAFDKLKDTEHVSLNRRACDEELIQDAANLCKEDEAAEDEEAALEAVGEANQLAFGT